MPDEPVADGVMCSLLLFVATPEEEEAVKQAARDHGLAPAKSKAKTLRGCSELGRVGNETVILVGPARESGRIVMGPHGRLGSAARAIQYRSVTGAQGIVQLGMAFGINEKQQNPGDVLVSTSLIPYDTRDVKTVPRSRLGKLLWGDKYTVDYTRVVRQPARPALVRLFEREQRRGGHDFEIRPGALLSGAARIHSARFRDELVLGVPAGEHPIVGGEMEGVGLLAASVGADDPIWCVVKGISDFADGGRDRVIEQYRPLACRNAARFVLAALVNDARA